MKSDSHMDLHYWRWLPELNQRLKLVYTKNGEEYLSLYKLVKYYDELITKHEAYKDFGLDYNWYRNYPDKFYYFD